MAKKPAAKKKTKSKAASTKKKSNARGVISDVGTFKHILRLSAAFLFIEALLIILLGRQVLLPVSIQGAGGAANVAEANLAVITGFVLLVTVITYLILTTTGWGWYLKNLQHKLNYMRWLHHGVSSSLMVVLVVLLSGMTNGLVLLLLFIVGVAVNLFGLLMELYNERRKRIVWNAYNYGVGVGVATWFSVLTIIALDALRTDQMPDNILLALYTLITVFSLSFAFNMRNHYLKVGNFKDYKFSEKNYILTNFLAKALFGIAIFFGYLA